VPPPSPRARELRGDPAALEPLLPLVPDPDVEPTPLLARPLLPRPLLPLDAPEPPLSPMPLDCEPPPLLMDPELPPDCPAPARLLRQLLNSSENFL